MYLPSQSHDAVWRPSAAPLLFLWRARFAALLIAVAGCSSSVARSSVDTDRDETIVRLTFDPESPTQIDVGNMSDSRRIEKGFVIENRCNERIKIAHMKTSCDCLTFEGVEAPLDPKEIARATLVVDLRDDPDFRGSLGINATGYDARGRTVFAAVVCTRVARQTDSSAAPTTPE